MLKPSMQDLMKRIDNRYLLVNLAAQRARDISVSEDAQSEEKPIKIALDEICDDKIEYRPGPKPEPAADILAAASSVQIKTVDIDLLPELPEEAEDIQQAAEEL